MGGRDEEAFRRLVDETWSALVRLGRLLVADNHAAEDLAQTALLKTWEHWPRLRAPEAASAYARTTLVRDASRFRDKRRREDRREPDDLPEPASSDPHAATPTQLMVRGALALLPYDQRAALVLRYLLDLSEAETATLLTGETLQSARWIGTFAYLVTFRAIDPLLVVDLSDPAAPRLRASLPSADTSTYLLQSDTGRLLGIGNAGNSTALKLYGVDNPDAPALLATAKVPGGSAGGSDPHALLYWRAGRLLFLPSYAGKVTVTTVGRDTLTPAFTLSQDAHKGRADDRIDRAVLIGHNAWTVSDRGVLVSNLAGGAEVAWLPN